jgi:hypothetical protein
VPVLEALLAGFHRERTEVAAGKRPKWRLPDADYGYRSHMMDQLHITSLRPGADGNHPDAPNAANYDEGKANPYPKLPDPLVLKNGKKVKSAKDWWHKRRPEIVEDFDREVYGRVPKVTPKVTWEVTVTTPEKIGEAPVITKKLLGHVDNSAYPAITVNIGLTLTTPASASGPVPVIMEFGFVPRPGSRMPPQTGPTWQQQVLAKGWGYAILIPGTVQADSGAGLTQGIIGLVNKGQPRQPDDWGALRAWAWGASRALDYFETDRAVDAKQVGIEGTVALRQGRHRGHGLRPALRHRINRIVGRRRGQAASPQLRRDRGERGRLGRISLDGGQLHQVCGTAELERSAGGFARVGGPVRAASGVHQRRRVQGRRLGGRQGHVPGCRLGAGPVYKIAGQEGSGDH